MWIEQLKIAIIQKDAELLSKLLDDIPSFKTKEEMEQAAYLLQEAVNIVVSLRDDVASSMLQIKKNLDFLKSTQQSNEIQFDIIS